MFVLTLEMFTLTNTMYKLIITKSIKRISLAKAIRWLYPTITIAELPKMIEGLQYEPLMFEDLFVKPEEISNVFNGVCEYTYQEYVEYKESDYGCCVPPWERKEYIHAKNWYLTLPKEDQDKIDILVAGNIPWA